MKHSSNVFGISALGYAELIIDISVMVLAEIVFEALLARIKL